MSDKKGLLPYVKKEIGNALHREISEMPRNQYVLETLRRLGEDNPRIAKFIYTFSLAANSKDEVLGIAYAGVLVYRLLESQAEADKMKGELEGKL